MTDKREKAAEDRREQENEAKHEKTPASDLYGRIEGKDPETGVEIPTEDAVEDAAEWIKENQR
ncbi:DUF3787 domain-containing protein [Peptoniphilus sp. KCTC 25270]|uniref:CDIF630_02480 family spore surface protein n=1 Tax=Peptoniphilus sp. KCTC 25270 TaxID=2897414 RepID=UPI001E4F0CF3|nr:DUF3787 domain-containing protein [Peptoniphilus sp. KCTC 25270]MCD1147735.1 DUF3787 domain-containing protein [Peptoniphilus sp. KCTC 25270]